MIRKQITCAVARSGACVCVCASSMYMYMYMYLYKYTHSYKHSSVTIGHDKLWGHVIIISPAVWRSRVLEAIGMVVYFNLLNDFSVDKVLPIVLPYLCRTKVWVEKMEPKSTPFALYLAADFGHSENQKSDNLASTSANIFSTWNVIF